MTQPYDALLVLSFGGPEAPEHVLPFLENVLRGRNVPRERMLAVAEHYYHFGGVSPINAQNRALIAALQAELDAHGPHLPIYWGNRNWHPLLSETLAQLVADGRRNVLVFVTSAFSSYSGCRQYREDLARASEPFGDTAPHFDKLRVFYNHPGYLGPVIENVRAAYAQLPEELRAEAPLVFTAHSIPQGMADGCRYEAQLREACRLVAEEVRPVSWQLVYQSRSGPPTQPWLEPDIGEHLQDLQRQGEQAAVVMPIGFISDHLEVLFDLDTEAAELCQAIGLTMVRAKTVGTHPEFVRAIRELVCERIDPSIPPRALGSCGPNHHICPATCCLPGHGRPLPPALAQREA